MAEAAKATMHAFHSPKSQCLVQTATWCIHLYVQLGTYMQLAPCMHMIIMSFHKTQNEVDPINVPCTNIPTPSPLSPLGQKTSHVPAKVPLSAYSYRTPFGTQVLGWYSDPSPRIPLVSTRAKNKPCASQSHFQHIHIGHLLAHRCFGNIVTQPTHP